VGSIFFWHDRAHKVDFVIATVCSKKLDNADIVSAGILRQPSG